MQYFPNVFDHRTFFPTTLILAELLSPPGPAKKEKVVSQILK